MKPLLHMENMNVRFLAEGLTAHKRAVDAYMRTRATENDKKALSLMKALQKETENREKAARLRARLGKLVDEDTLIKLADAPEKSPLAMLGIARASRNPLVDVHHYGTSFEMAALDAAKQGCFAARGTFVDGLLRERITEEKTGHVARLEFVFGLTDKVGGKRLAKCGKGGRKGAKQGVYANFGQEFETELEEVLLVAGQRLAMVPHVLPESLACIVREGLKKLAEGGHVDALRMLALAHVPSSDDWPEIAWAREQMELQAKKGKAHAQLAFAQHLAGLFPCWQPEGEKEENLARARDLLEKRTRKNDKWAKLLLALLHLPVDEDRTGPGHPVRTNEAGEFEDREGVDILEGLAAEDFAPAKAMLGAWLFNSRHDVEKAHELLSSACMQDFSGPCESAFADFLFGMALHEDLRESVLEGGRPRPEDFDPQTHGGLKRWSKELDELAGHASFGYSQTAWLRMRLDQRYGVGEPELETVYRRAARDFPGYAAVYAYLVNLGREWTYSIEFLCRDLARCMQEGAARGDEACILGSVFFWKTLTCDDFRDYDFDETAGLCEALAPASSLARAAWGLICLFRLMELEIRHPKVSQGSPESAALHEAKKSMALAHFTREYQQALRNKDITLFCMLPVLFKMAQEKFSSRVFEASIGRIRETFTDMPSRREYDFDSEVEEFIWTAVQPAQLAGGDMDTLWDNLDVSDLVSTGPLSQLVANMFFQRFFERTAEADAAAERRAEKKADRDKAARRVKSRQARRARRKR